MKTNVYLIRHGTTVWNKEKRLQGHHDSELHEIGLKQAGDLASYFHINKHVFSHVYSSDLQRASKTAEFIATKLEIPLCLSSDLRERNLGEWEGLTVNEIHSKYPDWVEIRNKGGLHGIEGSQEVSQRILKKLQHIVETHHGESIAVVSHGGAINSVLTVLTKGEHGTDKTYLENTSITHLQYDKEWTSISIGLTPHLTSS